MIKKIITIICIIALFCGLASVDLVKQQNGITVKPVNELEINFEATDHTASIVESEEYVFYAAADGIYRKERNIDNLCTKIVKGEATALQVFSNTLYFVTENKTKLCSVDFDGKNFNEVYEKPKDYVNRTITDYVAFGNGLVIADSSFPHYYDIINKKQYDIFETPRTLNTYDVNNQMLYYDNVSRKNLSIEGHIQNDFKYCSYRNTHLNPREIVAGDSYVYVLTYDNLLYKINEKEIVELVNFSNDEIKHIKKSGDHLYVMFEKHAERLLLSGDSPNGEYVGAVHDYDGGYFAIAEGGVYYKTKDGYSFAEQKVLTRLSGYFFSFKEDYKFEPSDIIHAKHEKVKISDTKIFTREDMLEFAKKEFKGNEDLYFLLSYVTWYRIDNVWEFHVVDRAEVEDLIGAPDDYFELIYTWGMFAMEGKTGMRIEEIHYEWLRNRKFDSTEEHENFETCE